MTIKESILGYNSGLSLWWHVKNYINDNHLLFGMWLRHETDKGPFMTLSQYKVAASKWEKKFDAQFGCLPTVEDDGSVTNATPEQQEAIKAALKKQSPVAENNTKENLE